MLQTDGSQGQLCRSGCAHNAVTYSILTTTYIQKIQPTHWVQTWVQVHSLAWGEQCEAFLPLELYKEIEGCIIMCVGGDATPPNPQIDLEMPSNLCNSEEQRPLGLPECFQNLESAPRVAEHSRIYLGKLI